MNDFGSEAKALLQSHIDDHGFLAWLGVTVESLESGSLEMRIPYDERLTNQTVPDRQGTDRTIHGGVAATLIDTAGGLAVRSDLSNPLSTEVATIDLNVSYLRPATGDILAKADIIRVGQTVGVAGVHVISTTNSDESTLVAVGRGSYRIFREANSD